MGKRRKISAVMLLGISVALLRTAGAQHKTAPVDDPLQVLQHGQLVVWVIRPVAVKGIEGRPLAEFNAPQPGFHQATPNTLGQPANSYGHDAASYGVDANSSTISAPPAGQTTNAKGATETLAPGYGEQTAGSYGQTAGSFGTESGKAGQTAASVGQVAGSYGTKAGSYGQTAGSLGEPAGSFGTSANKVAEVTPPAPPKTLRQEVEGELTAAYPNLKIQYAEFDSEELKTALHKAGTSKSYPDVLLFEGFPPKWAGPSVEVRELERTGGMGGALARSSGVGESKSKGECVVLRHAPHPRTSRAFLEYLQDQGGWASAAQ